MKRDDLYLTIRPLFEQKEIKTFRDIFKFVPETAFAGAMGKSTKRLKELIENVGEFTLREIVLIGSLSNLSLGEMFELIIPEYPPSQISTPTERDNSYKRVRAMYVDNKIETFNDIFKYVSFAMVAEDTGKSRSRLSGSINKSRIKQFPLETLVNIGNLCYLDLSETLKLVEAEYAKQTPKKP